MESHLQTILEQLPIEVLRAEQQRVQADLAELLAKHEIIVKVLAERRPDVL